MEFDFLEAADGLSLTKKFRLVTGGDIETEPYPYVKYVNSYREEANNIEQLGKVLQDHAAKNHCLLKGLLSEQLHNESRAGKTDATAPTQWILLDLDFEDGWDSIDDFIAELNPDWEDVSYVFQHSASAGIKYKAKLRGHLWLMLDKPMKPAMLKEWLRERNLVLDKLAAHFQLSANGMSLRWPLDTTTCQNDKLIYIAPPMVEGIEDPIADERFVVKKKSAELAPVPKLTLQPGVITQRTEDMVNKLRREAGYKKTKPKMQQLGVTEILKNPERATVTGVKEGRGFIYLNLNGGDSWGYYFPINKPDLLYNFKDEPVVRLKDIDPDFYYEYIRKTQQQQFGDLKPYVFREPLRDVYYNALYSPSRDNIELLCQASGKEKLADFMAQFAQPMPDPVEDWRVEFNPTTTQVIDQEERWINLFKPTKFIKYAGQLEVIDECPPVINKVIDSICCHDPEVKDHFMNWLACMFQRRQRNETAWIFHGVQGTGKGLLLSKILRPLLNPEHVTEWTMSHFEDHFNQPLEQTLLLWLDEFRVHSSSKAQQTMNKLKNYITEDQIAIRAMRSNATQVTNYMNIIVTANDPDPIHIPTHDRRFNVAPAQENKLQITQGEVDGIDDELVMFASYLQNYPACVDRARTVLQNDARQQMIEASSTAPEQFFAAFRRGDLDWFMSFLRADMPLNETLYYQQFQRVVIDWVRRCKEREKADDPIKVTRDEMINAYAYIIGAGMTPAKFTRMCSIHRVHLSRKRVNKQLVSGTEIEFKGDPQLMKEVLQNANENPLHAVK